MFGIGAYELMAVLGIAVLLFGGARIPSIARSLGQSITEFKKGAAGIPAEEETSKEPTVKS